MAITPISNNMNIIAALADEPNVDGGLTPAQLKAKFDEAGNILKTYINSTMIPGIAADIVAGGWIVGGEYNALTPYAINTVITYLFQVFVTLQAVTGVTPTNDGINYTLLIPAVPLDLGNNANQAYPGDKGKIAYDHTLIVAGNPHGTTVTDLGAVPNTRTVNAKPLSANITLVPSDVGAAPVSHVHGGITNAGEIGVTADLPIMTGVSGVLEARTVSNFRTVLGLGTTGALPVANGGTGQNTIANMRNAFGLGATSGAVPIANGGTNATTAAAALSNLGVVYSPTDLTANVSALTSGSFYFVYE